MIPFLDKHPKISWFLTILVAITLFYISSLSFPPSTSDSYFPSYYSILYHFSAFFALAFFLLPALVKGKNYSLVLLATLLGILYGISDELHQFFVPGRAMSIADIYLDTLGILTASLFYTLILIHRRNI